MRSVGRKTTSKHRLALFQSLAINTSITLTLDGWRQ
jgi:hypothetical protein